jgi:probable rRNA maturation factor
LVVLRRKLDGVSASALDRFAARARREAGLGDRAVDVLITNNRELRRLNHRFLGKDRPTDVLSFPAAVDGYAGEIAISADVARHSARELGHPLATELKVLMLHGMLHLAGHDHERDRGEMARLEQRLRRKLRLPSSLTERAEVRR